AVDDSRWAQEDRRLGAVKLVGSRRFGHGARERAQRPEGGRAGEEARAGDNRARGSHDWHDHASYRAERKGRDRRPAENLRGDEADGGAAARPALEGGVGGVRCTEPDRTRERPWDLGGWGVVSERARERSRGRSYREQRAIDGGRRGQPQDPRYLEAAGDQGRACDTESGSQGDGGVDALGAPDGTLRILHVQRYGSRNAAYGNEERRYHGPSRDGAAFWRGERGNGFHFGCGGRPGYSSGCAGQRRWRACHGDLPGPRGGRGTGGGPRFGGQGRA